MTSDGTVATRAPIADISADGDRVAFLVRSSPADCGHPVLWSAGTRALSRSRLLGPCAEFGTSSVYDIELAGSRVVWASFGACGNYCDAALKTATVGHPRTQVVSYNYGVVNSGDLKLPDYRLRGDGDLLVFDDGFSKPPRLMRLGTGREKCGESPCTTLRRDKHALPVDSVSAGLIAVREPDQVAIVDAQGALVRVFPFAPDEVSAARLDGGRLTVARLALLDVYDVASGTRQLSRPLPSGYTLADMDGGIALLQRADTIRLLRLSDGASHTIAPGRDVVADLEPSGLFYAYKAGTGGRLTFVSRAALVQQLK